MSLRKGSGIYNKLCVNCKCTPIETVVLTGFFISLPSTACVGEAAPNIQAYHSGTGPLPVLGDFVYSDAGGTTPVTHLVGQWISVATASSNTPILGTVALDEDGMSVTFTCK